MDGPKGQNTKNKRVLEGVSARSYIKTLGQKNLNMSKKLVIAEKRVLQNILQKL